MKAVINWSKAKDAIEGLALEASVRIWEAWDVLTETDWDAWALEKYDEALERAPIWKKKAAARWEKMKAWAIRAWEDSAGWCREASRAATGLAKRAGRKAAEIWKAARPHIKRMGARLAKAARIASLAAAKASKTLIRACERISKATAAIILTFSDAARLMAAEASKGWEMRQAIIAESRGR